MWEDWKHGIGWLSDRFPIAFVVTGIISVIAYIVTLALKAAFGMSEDNIGYVFAATALLIAPIVIGRYRSDDLEP